MQPWGTPAWFRLTITKTNVLRNICVYLAPFKKVPHLQSVMFLSTVSNATLRSSSNKGEILDSSIFNTLLIFAFSVLCCGWNPDWKGWSEQERVNFRAKQCSQWCLTKTAKFDMSQSLFINQASRLGLFKRGLGGCYANSISWHSLGLCDCPPLCLSVWASLLVPAHI